MIRELKQQLYKVKMYATAAAQYGYYFFLKNAKRKTGKTIFIDVEDNVFKRYLYGFIKFLHLAGYSVYMHPNLKLFYEMRNEKWEDLIFIEGLVTLGRPPRNTKFIHITKSNLSADYFLGMHDPSQQSYHVPMIQHPFMYNRGWWNQPLTGHLRKHSLFMAGNFDETMYKSFAEDGLFPIASRLEVYAFLQKRKLLYDIADTQDLINFTNDSADHTIVLLERRQINVPMDELRNTLSRFAFFFALPGIEIPYSHNLIEAMSCGCIPFIQQEYAAMMIPRLQNDVNAITFTGMNDLEDRIAFLFSLSTNETDKMRQEVFDYYNQFLTPEKVVAEMEKINFSKLYLQAEHESVALLKERKLANETSL